MKINKYCKFFIYFWTSMLFISVAIIALLLFAFSLLGLGALTDNPIAGSVMIVIGAYGAIYIVGWSLMLWFFPTGILLIIGVLAAPEEDEDQSGIGKLAVGLASLIIISIAGLGLFLILSRYNDYKLLSFAILIGSFILDGILLSSTFLGEKTEEFNPEVTQKIEEPKSGDRICYCSKCGKKIGDGEVFCKYCGNRL